MTEKQPVDGAFEALAGLTIAADSLSIGTRGGRLHADDLRGEHFPGEGGARWVAGCEDDHGFRARVRR